MCKRSHWYAWRRQPQKTVRQWYYVSLIVTLSLNILGKTKAWANYFWCSASVKRSGAGNSPPIGKGKVIYPRLNDIIFQQNMWIPPMLIASYQQPWQQPEYQTHWGRDKIAVILQTFSNALPWMTVYKFRLIYHWRLFLRFDLTIFQHGFG